jgi:hypothetical protein
MGYVSACNMCMSVKKDILFRVSTRNKAKSPDKGLVVGVYAHPLGLSSRTPNNMTDLTVRETAKSVP